MALLQGPSRAKISARARKKKKLRGGTRFRMLTLGPKGHKISEAYLRSEGAQDFGVDYMLRRGVIKSEEVRLTFFFGIDAEVMSISLADRPSISDEFMSFL